MGIMNVAIIGAGNIASQMAETLGQMDSNQVCAYAVASRHIEKAENFKTKYHFLKAYGSYEALLLDPKVDLVYVATPHALHFEHAKMCLEHHKNVLVEKAFTANASQARQLIQLAKEKQVLLAEAIWTRYMPFKSQIDALIEAGVIGKPYKIKAVFTLPNFVYKRMQDPSLAGGVLLDLGVYTLNFASMFFGEDIERMESTCKKYKTGVDATDKIWLYFKDGKQAELITSMVKLPKREATIIGDKGFIKILGINNPHSIEVYNQHDQKIETLSPPKQLTGYEYEILACKRAIEEGKIECQEMPHDLILHIMQQMDQLRLKWHLIYPFEKREDLMLKESIGE